MSTKGNKTSQHKPIPIRKDIQEIYTIDKSAIEAGKSSSNVINFFGSSSDNKYNPSYDKCLHPLLQIKDTTNYYNRSGKKYRNHHDDKNIDNTSTDATGDESIDEHVAYSSFLERSSFQENSGYGF